MRRTILLTIAVSFTWAGSVTAKDWWVPFDPGCGTIQGAINKCINGDTVWVYRGTYTGPGNRALDLKGLAITVRSSHGAASCFIDCGDVARGFYFHSGEGANTIIDGFTIRNGYATDWGGAIYCEFSSPTIKNCVVTDSTAENGYGGGIYCTGSSPTIDNCTISYNSAMFGGGVYCDYLSAPVISNCIIKDNVATSTISLLYCGGGVYCAGASPLISNCTISDNYAVSAVQNIEGYGGGIACEPDSSAVITDCTIIANAANYGGGISCYDASSVRISNCRISNNLTQRGDGGGVFLGRFDAGEVTNCAISGNSAQNCGGGIQLYGSAAAITNCIISGNSAQNSGAIDCYGASPNIINCTISSNIALVGFGHGGGISCEEEAGTPSVPTITNCIFEDNTEHAIYEVDEYSDPILSYCLFTNNPDGDFFDEGTTSYTGAANINTYVAGAHHNKDGDPLFVMNGPDGIEGTWTASPIYDTTTNRTTLTDSSATFVAGGLTGRHIRADITERSQFLIVSNTATTVQVPGDVRSLVGVGDGYRIIDYHLRPGSACINTGDPGFTVTTGPFDIDGEPRVIYGRVDIGADEFYENSCDFNNDVAVDFRDYAILANAWLAESGSPAWNPQCNLNGDSIINLEDLALFLEEWLFIAQPLPSISGRVAGAGQVPVEGVLVVAANGGSDMTDVQGYYQIRVRYNWSGTVIPAKAGYTFQPVQRIYNNVVVNQANQNYTATLLTYTISGTIRDPNTVPIAGVLVSANNGGSSDITNPNGDYSVTVNYGWSGIVTPTKTGYTFEPASRNYNNVTTNQTDQNYTGTAAGFGMSGALFQGTLYRPEWPTGSFAAGAICKASWTTSLLPVAAAGGLCGQKRADRGGGGAA
jgi:parallel beta-helix repeat protein